ncbi:MAG: hypothetical protein IJK07_07405 [Bacteroidales bacterium]|nr:hypothetical protein [Bacteroidales bacterium]
MKRLIIIALLLSCWGGATAQKAMSNADTAEQIVQRYFDITNYEALRRDSILYIETIIYKSIDTTDTAILKRWFLPPNRFRAELWHNDTLIEGCYTDGKSIYKEYSLGVINGWATITQSRYYVLEPGYDFRGHLYHRAANAAELTYKGEWNFNGQSVLRVFVDTPLQYCRNYLFEKDNGLLFLIEETNQHSEYTDHQAYTHPKWHAFHEYQPLGTVLLPSVESYQMDGEQVYHFSHYRYIPLDMKIFTQNEQ